MAFLLINFKSGIKGVPFGFAASKFPALLSKLLLFFQKCLAKICTLESERMRTPAYSWGRTMCQVDCFLRQHVLLVRDGSEFPAQLAQFLLFFEKAKTAGLHSLAQKAESRHMIEHFVLWRLCVAQELF